jgi:Predicted ATPase (AAA+ superfamily)
MYFDPEPKERREDLYDFEKEYKELKGAIELGERIVVIKGVRRTGKTSLMKVVCHELKDPKIFIDGRIVEPKQTEILNSLLQNSIFAMSDRFPSLKIRDLFKEISLAPFGIGPTVSISFGIKSFEKVDDLLERKNSKLIIFIDEAQGLKSGNIAGIVAHLFEHTRNILIVLAGSEVGILDLMTGESPAGDLYGRPKRIMELGRLSGEQGLEFLKLGFDQYGKTIKISDIEKAIETFDGVIGWLTLFGYYSKVHDPVRAIEMVKKEGSKITAREIEHFLQFRKEAKGKYLRLLEALSVPLRWVEVKRFLEAQEGRKINDRIVSKYIHEMEKYGLVIKNEENKYQLADPLVKEGVLLLTRGR